MRSRARATGLEMGSRTGAARFEVRSSAWATGFKIGLSVCKSSFHRSPSFSVDDSRYYLADCKGGCKTDYKD